MTPSRSPSTSRSLSAPHQARAALVVDPLGARGLVDDAQYIQPAGAELAARHALVLGACGRVVPVRGRRDVTPGSSDSMSPRARRTGRPAPALVGVQRQPVAAVGQRPHRPSPAHVSPGASPPGCASTPRKRARGDERARTSEGARPHTVRLHQQTGSRQPHSSPRELCIRASTLTPRHASRDAGSPPPLRRPPP